MRLRFGLRAPEKKGKNGIQGRSAFENKKARVSPGFFIETIQKKLKFNAAFTQKLKDISLLLQGAKGPRAYFQLHIAAEFRHPDLPFLQIGILTLLGAVIGMADQVFNIRSCFSDITNAGHEALLRAMKLRPSQTWFSPRASGG
jgi:hypothetical protein